MGGCPQGSKDWHKRSPVTLLVSYRPLQRVLLRRAATFRK